jgi:hypothetical protein
VFGKKKKSAVSAEIVLILHQQDVLSPDEIQQLVQAFIVDIDGADLQGVRGITAYKVGEPSRDGAYALVARLESEGKVSPDALGRTVTKAFETTKGSVVLAGVWREKPTVRQKD